MYLPIDLRMLIFNDSNVSIELALALILCEKIRQKLAFVIYIITCIYFVGKPLWTVLTNSS